MSFSFFTIPANEGRRRAETLAGGAVSSTQSVFTKILISIWVLLMAFGVVAVWNPAWMQELSRIGMFSESTHYKQYGDSFMSGRGDYKQAISSYQRSLEIMPDNTGAMVNMAIAYMYLGDSKKAVQLFREVLRSDDPPRGVVYYNMAEVLERDGRIPEAIECCRRAMNYSDVDPLQVQRRLGLLCAASDQYEEARQAFENCIEIETDPAYLYRSMLLLSLDLCKGDPENLAVVEGVLADDIGVDDLAAYDLETIQRMQKSSRDISRTYYHLARTLTKLNDTAQATTQLRKSLQIWRGNSDAFKLLNELSQ